MASATSLQGFLQGNAFQALVAYHLSRLQSEMTNAQSRLSIPAPAPVDLCVPLETVGPAVPTDLLAAQTIHDFTLESKCLAALPSALLEVVASCPANQQLLSLKTLRVYLSTAAHLHSGLSQATKKDQVATMLKAVSETFSTVVYEELISAPELLQEWVEEIVAIQKMVKPFIPPPTPEKGDSKGVLYAIKKQERTYGYLLGTFHYALTPEMQIAAKCSPLIHQKLSECTVIGTEIKLTSTDLPSVESNILTTAKSQAIPNFGIDAQERNQVTPTTTTTDLAQHKLEDCLRSASELCQAYQAGDIERLKPRDYETSPTFSIDPLRNAAMAQNIDVFLNIFERRAADHPEETPKGFFAVGLTHVVPNDAGVKVIPELLAERGWKVELLSQ